MDVDLANPHKVVSGVEFALYGLGRGASRLVELYDLRTGMTCLYDGMLHFQALSNKIGKIQARQARANERVLPRSVTRCYLLARHILKIIYGTPCDNKVLPLINVRTHTMTSLVSEIFSLNGPVKVLQVRHLFTSMNNVFNPKAHEQVVSDDTTSKRSGHSAITALKSYGTKILESVEVKNHRFHQELGECSRTNESGRLEEKRLIPITNEEQVGIIKAMFGKNAKFRNDAQAKLMEAVCSKDTPHVGACMPCGMGKSICAVSAVVHGFMRGNKRKSTIMIVPYTTLGAHQQISLQRSLDNVAMDHFKVTFYSGSDVSKSTVPEVFNVDSPFLLPDVIVLTIDAFDNLLGFHRHITSHWTSNSIIERIVLDEIHLALTERNFRESFECLNKVHTFGVQVIMLSATVTPAMVTDIGIHLGLIEDDDCRPFQIIHAGPAVPNDRFSLSVVNGNANDIANLIIKVTNGEAHTHILCSTIKMAGLIKNILQNMSTLRGSNLLVRVVTGNDSSDTKTAAAHDWQASKIHVLISTTCLVLGVENKLLKTCIVAGLTSNLSTLVQFLGRVRIENGSKDTSVVQFVVPHTSNVRESDVIDSMFEIGILHNTPKAQAESYFASENVQKLYDEKGCIIANLNIAMGHARTEDCLRCSNCLSMSHNNLSVSRSLHQLETPTGMGRHSTPLGAPLSVDNVQREGSCLYPNMFCVYEQKKHHERKQLCGGHPFQICQILILEIS